MKQEISTPAPASAPASAATAGSARSAAASTSAAGATAVQGELQIRNIAKAFGHTPVLHDICCDVRAGEFVTMLGPSGCGKTTLLRIIAGLEIPDRGQVILDGTLLNPLPANRRPVNTVFQSYALFPHLSVYENVAFGLRARGVDQQAVRGRVGPALDMLRIEKLAQRRPGQLSGGEKQRVALARALVNHPSVLLLDEPMSALDAKLRAEVQVELRRLQRRLGGTFILVTHDQDEALTVSDRIMVMHAGRIEQSGAPQAVYEHPCNRFVAAFLGAANLIAGKRQGEQVATELGLFTPCRTPPWQEGTLVIRPERINVRATPPAINALRATVREVIYRGSHLELSVEPGPLRVQAPVALAAAPGQQLWLELPPPCLEVLLD